jgi:hypothetical protein
MKTFNRLFLGFMLLSFVTACGKSIKSSGSSSGDGRTGTVTVQGADTNNNNNVPPGTRLCTEPVLLPSAPGFDMVAVLNKFAPERNTQNIVGPVTYCLDYNSASNTVYFRLEWEDDNGIASYPKAGSFFKVLLINPDPADTEVLIMDAGGFFSINGVMDSGTGKINGSFRFVNLPSLANIVQWGTSSQLNQCQTAAYTDNLSNPLRGFYKDASNNLHRCSTAFNIPLELWDSNMSTMAIEFNWPSSGNPYKNLIGISRDYVNPSFATNLLSLNIEQYLLGDFTTDPL